MTATDYQTIIEHVRNYKSPSGVHRILPDVHVDCSRSLGVGYDVTLRCEFGTRFVITDEALAMGNLEHISYAVDHALTTIRTTATNMMERWYPMRDADRRLR